MPNDLARVAVAAMRLQNGYALAVDTRDWTLFRTLFVPTVHAAYPHTDYSGIDEWLAEFVPFHEGCDWTLHVMTNHVVGEDEHGVWATCYGRIEWTRADAPGRISRAAALYRDRLVDDGGDWRITRRTLSLLQREPGVPFPPSLVLADSVASLQGPSPDDRDRQFPNR